MKPATGRSHRDTERKAGKDTYPLSGLSAFGTSLGDFGLVLFKFVSPPYPRCWPDCFVKPRLVESC